MNSAFTDPEQLATFAAIADHLIPAGHDMPSAGAVVNQQRLAFVIASRPDLADPVLAALRPELGADPAARLATLAADEPEHLAALQLAIVAGYYSDDEVRNRIGYPGQVARPVQALDFPAYVEEGLLDQVIARGPIWRNPTAPMPSTDGIGA
jgi:hypothetical protein